MKCMNDWIKKHSKHTIKIEYEDVKLPDEERYLASTFDRFWCHCIDCNERDCFTFFAYK